MYEKVLYHAKHWIGWKLQSGFGLFVLLPTPLLLPVIVKNEDTTLKKLRCRNT